MEDMNIFFFTKHTIILKWDTEDPILENDSVVYLHLLIKGKETQRQKIHWPEVT